MVRIIDGTLCALEDYSLTREKICRFIELMRGIGVSNLQISTPIYHTLEGKLPEGITYYLAVDTISYINDDFPKDEKIKYYFVPKQKNRECEIPAYQINDIGEPLRMPAVTKEELIKIAGVDNLLLRGCDAGMEVLKRKYRLQQVILCPKNTYSCATAIAILFLRNKGNAVITSFLGIGNHAATEQVIMAMHVIGRYMVNQTFETFTELKSWMEEVLHEQVSQMAPIVGNRIFYVESGIHVDGILKKPDNYEPYPPAQVGLERKVILGKHSGKNSIQYKINQLGLETLAGKDLEQLLKLVKDGSRNRGRAISDEEFKKMVEGCEHNGEQF